MGLIKSHVSLKVEVLSWLWPEGCKRVATKMEERGHGPRDMGDLSQLE